MSLKPRIPSVWLWINWLTLNGSCRNKLWETSASDLDLWQLAVTESLPWIFMVKMMKNVSLMQSRYCCQCVSRVSFLRTSCETEISAVNIIISSQVDDISHAALTLWYILNLSVPDTFETNPVFLFLLLFLYPASPPAGLSEKRMKKRRNWKALRAPWNVCVTPQWKLGRSPFNFLSLPSPWPRKGVRRARSLKRSSPPCRQPMKISAPSWRTSRSSYTRRNAR